MRTALFIFILFSAQLAAAQALTDRVAAHYETYKATTQRTKTILVFSQEKYIAGDTIFFAAWFLTEDGRLVGGKQIINLDVINANREVIYHMLFRVYDGTGSNQLIIPSSFPAGNYLMTAYNDFMKNFDNRFYFRKEIQVVARESIEPDLSRQSITVTAEGGHLIQGVSNRISVNGAVPGATAKLIRNAGLEAGTTLIDAYGTGSFRFLPGKDESYNIEISGKKIPVPTVENYGISLQLFTNAARGSLRLILSSPSGSSWRKQELSVVLTVNGQLYYTAGVIQGEKEISIIQVPQADLPEGLGLISVIAADNSLLASRHFYVTPASPLPCSIKLISDTLQTNQETNVEITLKDKSGKPFAGTFTVTALNAGIFPNDNIELSEAKNYPSSLQVSSGKSAALDNYLATLSGDIQWKDIMTGVRDTATGPPRLIALRGRAYFEDTNNPVPDSTLISCYMKKNDFSFEDAVTTNGLIEFTFLDFFGTDQMFYYAVSKGKLLENVRIAWAKPTNPGFSATPWKLTGKPDPYGVFMENKRVIDRAFDFVPEAPDTQTTSLFGSPLENRFKKMGLIVNLQDYKLFPDMKEMLREVVPRLYYRRQGGEDVVKVAFSDLEVKAKSGPLYVIDGRLTKSTKYFLSLSPADVISIQVVYEPDELSPVGAIGKNGIVIVKTKKGAGGAKITETSSEVTALNKPVPFHHLSPPPNTSYRRPDFRSTLFWDPAVKADPYGKANIHFTTSDDTGKIRIVVQGVIGTQLFREEKEVIVVR